MTQLKQNTSHPASPREEAQIKLPEPGQSRFKMIDVGDKPANKRKAIACGKLRMNQEAFDKLKNGTLPKGDALGLAEIAGINAAKQTASFLPMCHPLPIDVVRLGWELNNDACEVLLRCEVSCIAKTGVEMEALAGVNGGLLCLYDLIKGTDSALCIDGVRLEIKEGGKKGFWVHPKADEVWHNVQKNNCNFGKAAGIIILSDRASQGVYEDLSGPVLIDLLNKRGCENVLYEIIPDNEDALSAVLQKWSKLDMPLILTSGGTGPSVKDITPEIVEKLSDKIFPGIGEALRQHGRQFTKTTWLSRSVGARLKNSLVVTLPGNPKAISESFPVLDDVVPTILKLIERDAS